MEQTQRFNRNYFANADIGTEMNIYTTADAGTFEKGESKSRSAFVTDRNLTVVPFRSLARESNR